MTSQTHFGCCNSHLCSSICLRAHAPLPNLLHSLVTLIDISLLKEGEVCFMEERIKRYFRKGYKYLEIILFLDKRQHMQLSK